MNFHLDHIPERSTRPRTNGMTMVMDKGLSLQEAQNLVDSSLPHIDYIKLGFGTAYVTQNLEEKINLYQSHGIQVFLGGTLFEVFYGRKAVPAFEELVKKLNLSTVEISDGSITIPQEEKCDIIRHFKSLGCNVLSEVGSKSADTLIPPYKWIDMMQKELEAGSSKVIAEAREGGNVGIYRGGGEIRSDLIEEITRHVDMDKILWEAPKKEQQVWFIKRVGCNVNLGNIAPNEVIPLECLRLGLRSDTFFDFLPQ